MKILLRRWYNKYYVWKNAEYINNNYYVCENDKKTQIKQTNILSVTEDNRANLVQCLHCGAMIKNDPESIEAHFAEREAKRNCFECDQMAQYGDQKNLKVKYVKNADGTYHAEEVYDTMLGCGFSSWKYKNIDTEEAKNGCQYYRCRKSGVSKIDDIFVKYPGIFNKQITLDALIKKGFKVDYCTSNTRQWYVELGLRGKTLYAVVNELSIVEYFVIHHRYSRYIAFYSEQYDQLFFDNGERYIDTLPEELSQNKYNSAKKIIAALYKEA